MAIQTVTSRNDDSYKEIEPLRTGSIQKEKNGSHVIDASRTDDGFVKYELESVLKKIEG